MARLALELSLPAVPAWLTGGGGVGGAGGILGDELNGLAFDAATDTMIIRDTITPANVYNGSLGAKCGPCRASAALLYGPTGFLEWGPENLFPEVSSWALNGATITNNATTAPDGTNTGILITATASPNAGILLATLGTSDGAWYTSSAYVKYDTANFVRFSITGLDGDHMTYFDMFLGAVASNPGGNVAHIEDAGNGWRRISISRTLVPGPAFPLIVLTDADGLDAVTLGKTLYAWGVQFEHGNLKPYLRTTTGAAYGLRRDYDPRLMGNKPGYLSERVKTNYILSSRNLADATYWNASGASVVANQAVSAMGDTTLAKWTTIGMTDDGLFISNAAGDNGPGKVWIISFWAKCETGTYTLPVLMDSTSGPYLNTSVILTTTLKRHYVVGVADGTASAAFRIFFGKFNTLSATPSAVIYIGDVQAEISDNTYPGITGPSSYIPTTTATVTRAADTAHISTTKFPYASQTSTLYVKWLEVANRGGNALLLNNLEFDYGNYMGLAGGGSYPPYGGVAVQAYMASGLVNNYQIPNKPQGVPYKAAFGWAPNNNNMAFEGLMASVDDTNDPTYPVLNELAIGYGIIYVNQLDGWVLEGMYLPRRMTNSQLQVQTGGDPIYSAAEVVLGIAETNGIAWAASDDSMVIKDTTNPAKNYLGSAVAKFGSVRASAGTQYGSTGLLEWAPENMLTQSQTLIGGPWGNNSSTIAADVIAAPDGFMTADRLDALASANSTLYNVVTLSSLPNVCTCSIYAKKGTANWFYMDPYDGTSYPSWFNLATGVVGTSTAGNTAAITDAGNGWWRCSVTRLLLGNIYLSFGVSDADNSSVLAAPSTVYMWGAQINHGVTAQPYLVTTTSPVYALRRDYDPAVAGAKFLMEEQRTNICVNSQNIAAFNQNDFTALADQIAAPDGTMTADLLTASGAANPHAFAAASDAVSGLHTWSCYVKQGTANFAKLSAHDGANHWSYFNLNTGLPGTNEAGNTSKMEAVGGGWYRCSVTRTSIASFAVVGLCDADNAVAATIGKTLYVWGYQIEVGPNASSYIPTTSMSVTRAQDLPVLIGQTLSDTAGSIYAKCATPPGAAYNTSIMMYGSNELLMIHNDASPRSFAIMYVGSYPSFQFVPEPTPLVYAKMALGWAPDNANAARNGTIAGADNLTGGPTVLLAGGAIYLGRREYDGAALNGWMSEGMYLPRRLTNAEMVTRTT